MVSDGLFQELISNANRELPGLFHKNQKLLKCHLEEAHQ